MPAGPLLINFVFLFVALNGHHGMKYCASECSVINHQAMAKIKLQARRPTDNVMGIIIAYCHRRRPTT
jgi:hypothetical protein